MITLSLVTVPYLDFLKIFCFSNFSPYFGSFLADSLLFQCYLILKRCLLTGVLWLSRWDIDKACPNVENTRIRWYYSVSFSLFIFFFKISDMTSHLSIVREWQAHVSCILHPKIHPKSAENRRFLFKKYWYYEGSSRKLFRLFLYMFSAWSSWHTRTTDSSP